MNEISSNNAQVLYNNNREILGVTKEGKLFEIKWYDLLGRFKNFITDPKGQKVVAAAIKTLQDVNKALDDKGIDTAICKVIPSKFLETLPEDTKIFLAEIEDVTFEQMRIMKQFRSVETKDITPNEARSRVEKIITQIANSIDITSIDQACRRILAAKFSLEETVAAIKPAAKQEEIKQLFSDFDQVHKQISMIQSRVRDKIGTKEYHRLPNHVQALFKRIQDGSAFTLSCMAHFYEFRPLLQKEEHRKVNHQDFGRELYNCMRFKEWMPGGNVSDEELTPAQLVCRKIGNLSAQIAQKHHNLGEE